MTPDLPNVEIAIVELTNAFRRQQKLGELRRSATLDSAAKSFARYLARTGKFSHTADGRRPADRTRNAGYEHCRVSENLALNVDTRGFRTRQLARGAIKGWKHSPPHRKAMSDKLVTEIGVGVAKAAGEHRYLSVQLFGRPRALQYRFTIRNLAPQRISYAQSGRQHHLPAHTEVQHTECKPIRLRFKRILAAEHRRNPIYSTRDGDLFVVRAKRNGQLVVEHRPQLN